MEGNAARQGAVSQCPVLCVVCIVHLPQLLVLTYHYYVLLLTTEALTDAVLCSHRRPVGGGSGAGAGDAEGQRDGADGPHRAERGQRAALRVPDPHGARDCGEGV